MHKRKVAIGLVLVGALLLALGVLYRDWWSGKVFYGTELSLGVRSFEVCGEGRCETGSLAKLADSEHSGWTTTGSLLFYVGLAAAAVLVLIGGLELAGKRPRVPIAPTTVGFLLSTAALLLGFVFVMLKPTGLHGSGLQAGLSFFILAAGGIAGLMGSIFMAKVHALEDDAQWLATASAEHAAEAAPSPWLDQ